MIFKIHQSDSTKETPFLKERVSDLLNFHPDRLTVTYTGKSNPSVPAVIKNQSVHCSTPARPSGDSYVFYFEVKILCINQNRPSIVIGLIDDFSVQSKIPGSSKKSFGLRSDGKLLHAQAQGGEFSHKFVVNDIIGCGISYISRKIFFTRNGELLGTPFNLTETGNLYAAASLQCPLDSVSFNFLGPFQYNLDELHHIERSTLEKEVDNEFIDSREVYKVVREYLEFQGYPNALKALEENMEGKRKKEKVEMKTRSYSGRISERYDSIDIDPSCTNCQTFGKVCKVCLKKIMENVEAGVSIRLPDSRNRCDSVDISSLYLKQSEIVDFPAPESPLYLKDVKKRGTLRNLIITGSVKAAQDYLTENFPEMLCDDLCMLYLHVQEFIEIIKQGEIESALDFARAHLSNYRNHSVYCRKSTDKEIFIWEIVGLLAYPDPTTSPLSPLLTIEQLELTADLVNERILQRTTDTKSSLECILKQTLASQYLYQEHFLMSKPSNISFSL